MSGSSWDDFHLKIKNAIGKMVRRRVLKHLEALEKLCKDIERSDSGDTEQTQWTASAERFFNSIPEGPKPEIPVPRALAPNARNGNEDGASKKSRIVVTRKLVTTEASWQDVPQGNDPLTFGKKLVETLKDDPFERDSEWAECDISEPYDYTVAVVDEGTK